MERPPIPGRTELEEFTLIVPFAGLDIAVRTRSRELSERVAKDLGLSGSARPRNVIAEMKLSAERGDFRDTLSLFIELMKDFAGITIPQS